MPNCSSWFVKKSVYHLPLSDIQGLLSEVIKQLLPLDITNSLPKTIKDVSERLKGREDTKLTGSLRNKADETEMLKVIQSITHLAITKITILPTLMKFSSGDKVHLSLPVEISIKGESTKSGVFSSEVKVKIDVVSKLLWDSSKNQIFIIEASRIFINDIQVKHQKSVAGPDENNMQSVVWTILIDVIRHCIRLVADILNVSLLSTLASAVPVGTFGTIHYDLIGSPKVNDRYFLIPYQATFQVSLPGSPPRTTLFQVTPQSGTNFHLTLSKDFISIGIAALTGGCSANLTKGAGKQLMTTDLASAITKISERFPAPQPLVVKIRGSDFPLISIDSQSVVVKQPLFSDVFVHGQSVLQWEIVIIFNAKLSASNGKLLISLSQKSFDSVQASSSVGSTNAQKLHEYINDLHTNSFLPAMNGMLRRGITLPSMLNVKWTKVNTALFQDGLVISM
ncbi:BPI fold-containing family B member 4-like [Podarcis lilfordi]|uniref:BPI fold-containing family B member 4-like n=1 Tax=Podarcis lilfordi TaxID=74358 RepID=A0AA35KGS1_9SAUR|nr:BPI fold-containing family B member 4-like [Podarcis lilfordi]